MNRLAPALAFALAALAGATVARADESREAYALVIGINAYPNLSPAEQLRGAAGDARAMRKLLVGRLGFADDNVTTLIDSEATAAAIRRELGRLADRAKGARPGADPPLFVLHYSGHGSQVADQPPGSPGHDEADGKDETLVPHDATKQGGPEDIRDDELFAWAKAIGSGGRARAIVILDCCHSGTGLRGDLPVRQLVRGGPETPAPSAEASFDAFEGESLPRGVVALSACRAGEVEPEYRDGAEDHGLLTRFLIEVLGSQSRISSLSYRTLRDAIIARYATDRGVPAPPPAPQLDGDLADLDATAFGAGPELDRPPYFPLTAGRGKATLQAGRLHGLGPGSRLAVYSRPEEIGQGPPAAARLTLTSCDLLQSEGTLEGAPADFRSGFAVPVGGRAPASAPLRLKVLSDGNPVRRPDLPPAVSRALDDAVGPDEAPWLELVETADGACDLVLRRSGSSGMLVPAAGRRGTAGEEVDSPWAPIPLDGQRGAAALGAALRKNARVGNLLRLASGGDGGPLRSAIKLELLEVLEADESNRILRHRPWPADPDGQTRVAPGRLYALKATNTKRDKPAFISVFSINPESLSIKLVLPSLDASSEADQHKLAPGQSRISAMMRSGSPDGLRHALLVASEEPHDVSYLVQDALPSGRAGGSDLDSALAREAFFRGVKPRPASNRPPAWGMSALTWRAEGGR